MEAWVTFKNRQDYMPQNLDPTDHQSILLIILLMILLMISLISFQFLYHPCSKFVSNCTTAYSNLTKV